jgi:hypothetical protein
MRWQDFHCENAVSRSHELSMSVCGDHMKLPLTQQPAQKWSLVWLACLVCAIVVPKPLNYEAG